MKISKETSKRKSALNQQSKLLSRIFSLEEMMQYLKEEESIVISINCFPHKEIYIYIVIPVHTY